MDLYTEFISLEPDLFSMNIENSYARLNATEDDVILQCVDQIVDSLFSTIATLVCLDFFRGREVLSSTNGFDRVLFPSFVPGLERQRKW